MRLELPKLDTASQAVRALLEAARNAATIGEAAMLYRRATKESAR